MVETEAQGHYSCASCVHFSRERSNLAAFGFGHCVHVPRYRSFSALAPCAFTPPRWSKGNAKTNPAGNALAND